MQIVYHLGAHCTDEERLLRCLLRNRGALAPENIVVPGPKRYRTLLRDAAAQLGGRPASRETQTMLLDQIMDEDGAERLILSWDQFPGIARNAAREALYANAGRRMQAFARIFPETECEFHLAICNPAVFLPQVFRKQAVLSREAFFGPTDPRALRWSDMVASLRGANPDVPVTVWCDEDAPVLWPEILQAVSGHSDLVQLSGTLDRAAELMEPEGASALTGWLEAHPAAGAAARRAAIAHFLAAHARPEAMEIEVELDGFDARLASELTEAYEQDVERIAGIGGVRVLRP